MLRMLMVTVVVADIAVGVPLSGGESSVTVTVTVFMLLAGVCEKAMVGSSTVIKPLHAPILNKALSGPPSVKESSWPASGSDAKMGSPTAVLTLLFS